MTRLAVGSCRLYALNNDTRCALDKFLRTVHIDIDCRRCQCSLTPQLLVALGMTILHEYLVDIYRVTTSMEIFVCELI